MYSCYIFCVLQRLANYSKVHFVTICMPYIFQMIFIFLYFDCVKPMTTMQQVG